MATVTTAHPAARDLPSTAPEGHRADRHELREGDEHLASCGYGPLEAPQDQRRPLEDLVQAALSDLADRLDP